MEEFIFGTLATDDLKLLHHRAARSGVHHAYAISPRDPQPGQPVTITVEVGPDIPASQVACAYTLDSSLPGQGQAAGGQVVMLSRASAEWDTLTWGYRTLWQGAIPAQPVGTVVRYRITARNDNGTQIAADWPDVKMTVERAAGAFFHRQPLPNVRLMGDPAAGQVFVYHVDTLTPPEWARQAVIYHIFVDRFFPGQGRGWRQTRNLRDFCGGTLWGIAEKLDYIAELGATAIWLSPIFPSPTYHGYDATGYEHVEPRMGGDEALHALVEAAHARGLRVILDLVCNHLSDRHPLFVEAQANPASPYRDWFYFDPQEKIGYRAFFGVREMPQVNLDHPAARAWMIDVGRYWLREFDVDGYRLDHANGPGPGFWSDFRAACRAEKPDSFVFGEIVEPPDVLLQYVGRLDGTLDFQLGDALRHTYARRRWTEDQFQAMASRHLAYFPPGFLLPTFLDNHDMDRFLFIAGGDREALRRAAAVQMELPGPPAIYYGTEIGMSQTGGKADSAGLETSRAPMVWDTTHQDTGLLADYRKLIRSRMSSRPWAR
jgi:hypothetical protein